MTPEPILDIAHLGHLELLTPKFEASREFFIDMYNMRELLAKAGLVYVDKPEDV